MAQIPAVFKPLMTTKKRIKLYYGGRGGGKSYAFADSLLFLARTKKMFIVCLRELQSSMKESVHKLLCDRIAFYELNDYKILETRIENVVTGSVFIFKGLRDQDGQKIKSLEGADIAWVEEGQTISQKSWDILEPTIRKAGSEIWISMNREQENDPLWRSVAQNPDENTLVVQVNFSDNPFCPDELKALAAKCQRERPDDYAHIWLGAPVMQGNTKLIGLKEVLTAANGKIAASDSPLVIGVDIARFGDDATALCYRRGRWCYRMETLHGADTVAVANKITHVIQTLCPARVFLDIGGQGAGVYDILVDRGFGKVVRGVFFGEKAIREERYLNRRAEMWDNVREWLAGALPVEIPNDEALIGDLTSVHKKYDRRGRLQLEEKAEIKKRLGRSPDKGDALALTFAEPVYDTGHAETFGSNGQVAIEQLFRDCARSNNGW